jgi:uncharacterized protein (TIGR00725 family)
MVQGRIITVFGSYEPLRGSAEYEQAYQVGHELARAGFVIANGGYAGTMEASAKGAKEAGGRTIGVTCSSFRRSQANPYIDQEIPTANLRDRLEKLIGLGSGYVALPGGTGTLTELAYAWELMNKGSLTGKTLVILGDFWQPLIELVENANQRTRGLVQRAKEPKDLLEIFGPPRRDMSKS